MDIERLSMLQFQKRQECLARILARQVELKRRIGGDQNWSFSPEEPTEGERYRMLTKGVSNCPLVTVTSHHVDVSSSEPDVLTALVQASPFILVKYKCLVRTLEELLAAGQTVMMGRKQNFAQLSVRYSNQRMYELDLPSSPAQIPPNSEGISVMELYYSPSDYHLSSVKYTIAKGVQDFKYTFLTGGIVYKLSPGDSDVLYTAAPASLIYETKMFIQLDHEFEEKRNQSDVYKVSNEDFAYSFTAVRTPEVGLLLEAIPCEMVVVAPGDGCGIVASQWSPRQGVYGDPFPPVHAHEEVQKETGEMTIARGCEIVGEKILILSYVARFLEEQIVKDFPGPVLCLDTHMVLSELNGFEKILPTVYVQNVSKKMKEDIVRSLGGRRLDDDIAHLAYTERLMRVKQPVKFFHWSHFVDYFVRTCSPQVSEHCRDFRTAVELAGGSLVAVSPETTLVSNLQELREFVREDEEVYYAPFGRTMSRQDIRDVCELNGDFYCRTLYCIPNSLVKCLPFGISYRWWDKDHVVFYRADDTSVSYRFAYSGSSIMRGTMNFFRYRADIKAARKFYRPMGNNDYHVAAAINDDELGIDEVIQSFRRKFPYKDLTDRQIEQTVRSSPHYERRGQKWKFKKISLRDDTVQEITQEKLDRLLPLRSKIIPQFQIIRELEEMFPSVTIFTRTIERLMARPDVETHLIRGIVYLCRR